MRFLNSRLGFLECIFHPLAWTPVSGVQNPSMEVIQCQEGMVAAISKSVYNCCVRTLQLGEGHASHSAVCSWKSECIDQTLGSLIPSVYPTLDTRP